MGDDYKFLLLVVNFLDEIFFLIIKGFLGNKFMDVIGFELVILLMLMMYFN